MDKVRRETVGTELAELADHVADDAAEAVTDVLRKATPDIDDEAAKNVLATVWAAVAVAVERPARWL